MSGFTAQGTLQTNQISIFGTPSANTDGITVGYFNSHASGVQGFTGPQGVSGPSPYDASGATLANSTSQSVSTSYTAITFDTHKLLGSAFTHSTGTNPSRLTVNNTGNYFISFSCASENDHLLTAKLRKNGTTDLSLSTSSGGFLTSSKPITWSTIQDLTAGDYIELYVLANTSDFILNHNLCITQLAVGAQGVMGVQGTVGPQGFTGAGVQGFSGVQGITGAAGSINLSTGPIPYWEDFFWAPSNSSTKDGVFGFNGAVGGSGSPLVQGAATADSGHPGLVDLNTGASSGASTGALLYTSNGLGPILGGGAWSVEWLVQIPTLSTGTDTFTAYAGLMNISSPGVPPNGVFFRYTDAVNSGKWQCVCRKAGTESTQDTTVAVVAGTWYRLRIDVNAAGTSVTFTCNGTVATAITTNIPIVSLGFDAQILKGAGTNTRDMYLDYCYASWTPTTPR